MSDPCQFWLTFSRSPSDERRYETSLTKILQTTIFSCEQTSENMLVSPNI